MNRVDTTKRKQKSDTILKENGFYRVNSQQPKAITIAAVAVIALSSGTNAQLYNMVPSTWPNYIIAYWNSLGYNQLPYN
ncbi:hypothetical protein BB559_000748 [Furculomyces boomerangus]|uniref:Uncharacterized protein n=2 Tax=Harpellales TaxID=61421 RepID=A0A2T9Z4F2_9FUNG|nr:hypothetical protein BB559_000748 [Furculomyces boomerangus]PWA01022.1 hypothetical protein BB558_002902 [Smittium angustum]